MLQASNSLTVGAGAVSDYFACFLGLFPPTGLPHIALVGEKVSSLTASWISHNWLVSMGGLPFSEEKKRRSWSWVVRGKVGEGIGRRGKGKNKNKQTTK